VTSIQFSLCIVTPLWPVVRISLACVPSCRLIYTAAQPREIPSIPRMINSVFQFNSGRLKDVNGGLRNLSKARRVKIKGGCKADMGRSAACYERCRTCRQWHKKVWLWPDSNLAWWPTLARCGRSSNVHTRCHHAQMLAWQGSTVPRRLLHTGHRCCRRLRSATQQLMVVPRHRLTTVGRRAFAVHDPMVWNSLPDDLRAQQDYESFRRAWKPGFSPNTSVFSALETFVIITLYKIDIYHTLPYHGTTAQISGFYCMRATKTTVCNSYRMQFLRALSWFGFFLDSRIIALTLVFISVHCCKIRKPITLLIWYAFQTIMLHSRCEETLCVRC